MSDGKATSTANVSIEVKPDAPVAVDDSYSTNENHAITIAAPGILGNDHTDAVGDPIHLAVIDAPTHGALTSVTDPDGSRRSDCAELPVAN